MSGMLKSIPGKNQVINEYYPILCIGTRRMDFINHVIYMKCPVLLNDGVVNEASYDAGEEIEELSLV
jgi:hypothetical protein